MGENNKNQENNNNQEWEKLKTTFVPWSIDLFLDMEKADILLVVDLFNVRVFYEFLNFWEDK